MKTPEPPRAISPPDPNVLVVLALIQYVALAVILCITLPTLVLRLFPGIRSAFFPNIHLMTINVAALILFAACSVVFSDLRVPKRWALVGTAIGVLVATFAALTALEFWNIILFPHLDALLAPQPTGGGRMAPQSAIALCLIGLSAATIRVRRRILSPLVDAITFSMCLFMLIVVFGYFFGAMHLFGLATDNRLYPSAFVCLTLLALCVFNRRAEHGFFAVLLSSGIGGKTMRLAAPWAILLPFLLTAARGLVSRWHLIRDEYSTEGAAAILSVLGFVLLLVTSRRSDRSEIAIRELSLRDELTRLYNRRGFYILAEQALRLARRDREAFSVLFIDVDNLKIINDALGHDAGSDLLAEMAQLLQSTFREIDVIGRLGGDEFVVAARCDEAAIAQAAARLVASARETATNPARPYPLRFSLGHVTSPASRESLDDLLAAADTIMYESKRLKKAGNHDTAILSTI
jgi:diguanylate cyclase (GGDEF)-like protein